MMNHFPILFFIVILVFASCVESSSNSKTHEAGQADQLSLKKLECKQIPSNWLLLSNNEKMDWLSQKKKICLAKENSVLSPFLLDLMELYINENSTYRKNLIYNSLLMVHVPGEAYPTMHKDLLLLKRKYPDKGLQFELFFIMRTVFRRVPSWKIQQLVFGPPDGSPSR